ncbi:hypothetical protein LCGC14_0903820, partial [marine sediment metagenome]
TASWGDKEDENSIKLKETAREKLWSWWDGIAYDNLKQFGVTRKSLETFRTAVEYGILSAMTDKNFATDESFGGYFDPFVVSSIVRSIEGIKPDRPGIMNFIIDKVPELVMPQFAKLTTRAMIQLAANEHQDTKGNELRKEFGLGNAIGYALFSRDLEDVIASNERFVGTFNPTRTEDDKRDFMQTLLSSGNGYNISKGKLWKSGKNKISTQDLIWQQNYNPQFKDFYNNATDTKYAIQDIFNGSELPDKQGKSIKKADEWIKRNEDLIRIVARGDMSAYDEYIETGKYKPIYQETGRAEEYDRLRKAFRKDVGKYYAAIALGEGLQGSLDITVNQNREGGKRFIVNLRWPEERAYNPNPYINIKIKDFPPEDRGYQYALKKFHAKMVREQLLPKYPKRRVRQSPQTYKRQLELRQPQYQDVFR